MSTTSFKLPDELKQRASKAAQELGISPHAFMVEAIRNAADAVEQRSAIVEQALAARAEMQQIELVHNTDNVHTYSRKHIDDQHRPIEQIQECTERPWNEQHATFIAAYNRLVETEGVALQEWSAF